MHAVIYSLRRTSQCLIANSNMAWMAADDICRSHICYLPLAPHNLIHVPEVVKAMVRNRSRPPVSCTKVPAANNKSASGKLSSVMHGSVTLYSALCRALYFAFCMYSRQWQVAAPSITQLRRMAMQMLHPPCVL